MESLAGSWAKRDGSSSIAGLYSNPGNAANYTQDLFNTLAWDEIKSMRSSVIILTSFNILAATTTAVSILQDSNWLRRPVKAGSSERKFCPSTIHPAEVFPLIQAVALIIQALLFAASQATGLGTLVAPGCRTASQIMFPAVFLVAYVQLVFGIECAVRSLRRPMFPARGKYDLAICLGSVVILELGTWAVAYGVPTPDLCFASLMWFTGEYGVAGLAISGFITVAAIGLAALIFIQLYKTSLVDEDQRIAASRMVYYLLVLVVGMAFVAPFYLILTIQQNAIKAAAIATVVLNLSGLMTGLLHLFLRANTASTAFKPRGLPCGVEKHDIRFFGPNELRYGASMSSAQSSTRSEKFPTNDSVEDLLATNGIELSPTTTTTKDSKKAAADGRPYYSLFPRPHNKRPSKAFLPSLGKGSMSKEEAILDLSPLEPPRLDPDGWNHRRYSSVISHATVQIGLRLSQAPLADMFISIGDEAMKSPGAAPQLQPLNIGSPSGRFLGLPSRPKAGDPMKSLPPTPGLTSPTPQDFPEQLLQPAVYKPSDLKRVSSVPALLWAEEARAVKPTVMGPPRAAPGTVGSPLRLIGSPRLLSPAASAVRKHSEWI